MPIEEERYEELKLLQTMFWRKKEQLFDGIDDLAEEIIMNNANKMKSNVLSPKYFSPINKKGPSIDVSPVGK